MPVNFSNFTSSTSPVDTDQIVGYSVAASGGERRWTLASLRSSLIKGAASSIDTENLSVSKALISTNVGKVGASTTTAAEIGYLAGARSNIQQQLDSSLPSGAVMPFAMRGAPSGWLECDGRPVSITLYNNLYIALESGAIYGKPNSTTFNLPDLRGYFVRGWDNGRGVDTGRGFGSNQADDFKSHRHGFTGANGNTDAQSASPFQIVNDDAEQTWAPGSTANTGHKGILDTGGTETRPKNIAMMYCIKI